MKLKKLLTLAMICLALGASAQNDSTEVKQRKPKKEDPKKALQELQKQFDQLQKEHLQLQEAYRMLQTQDSTMQADLLAQEDTRRQQEAYYQQCRHNLYEEYKEYLDIPFSSISLQKISAIREFAATNADIDADAPALQARADACLTHKQDYDRMIMLLKQPYSMDEIKRMRTELLVLRNLAKDEKWDELAMSRRQWNETDSIDLFYARYQPGVKWLQNVMKRCEQQFTSDGLNANNRADVVLSRDIRQQIINDADKKEVEGYDRPVSVQGNIADYILLIPWLRERYEIFTDEPNPLKPTQKTLHAIKEVLDINSGL